MKSVLHKIICCLLVSIFITGSIKVQASGKYYDKNSVSLPEMTELAAYAFSWADNKNILYVYGGPGRGHSLEECDERKLGTDCSGFVQSVYSHFGLDLQGAGTTDATIYSSAIKRFNSESEAVPGDVLRWEGHVGIYLGQGKMVHTNTSNPPYNFIHVADVNYRGTPPVYLRMVDDISKLGKMGKIDANNTIKNIGKAESINNIITESDLTGLPIPETIIEEQRRIELAGSSSLNINELENLEEIKAHLSSEKSNIIQIVRSAIAGIGIFLMLYGVLLTVCYVFDRTNNFIDISLLKVISFGRWEIQREDVNIKSAKYLSIKGLLSRFFFVEIVGMILISGLCYKIVFYLFNILRNLM